MGKKAKEDKELEKVSEETADGDEVQEGIEQIDQSEEPVDGSPS